MAFPLNSCFLTLESVYGDEGRGFGRNDPGVEVGQLVRFQVAAEDLRVEGERDHVMKLQRDSAQESSQL